MCRCIRCGDCCEFLALNAALDVIRADPNYPERDFILQHCTRTVAPTEKPNPLMSDKCFNGYIWYKCDLFDKKTRLCKDYKNRSAFCKEYPGNRKPESLISARCGFMEKK